MIYIEGTADKPLTADMLTISPDTFTYDGADKAPTITVKDGDLDLIAAGVVSLSGDLISSVAGSHSVTATANASSGYIGSIAGNWVIEGSGGGGGGGTDPDNPGTYINGNSVAQTADSIPMTVIAIELGIALLALLIYLYIKISPQKNQKV